MDVMNPYGGSFEHNRRKSRSLKDRFYHTRHGDNEHNDESGSYQQQNHHAENLVKHEVVSNYGDEEDEKMEDEVEDLSKN
jgi:hypothetical protein